LLEVDGLAQVRANVYVPEFAMDQVCVGQKVRLLAEGQVRPVSATVASVAPKFALAQGLVPKDQLQGINPPRYFLGTVWLKNDGQLLPGAMGTAKVLVARRSLGSFGLRFCRELVYRKVW